VSFLRFFRHDFLSHIPVIVAFVIPAVVFCGYCLFVAYKAWINISVENARRISFVAAILLALMIGGGIIQIFEKSVWRQIAAPIAMIIAGLFYLAFNKSLMKWLDLSCQTDWEKHAKSVRRFFWWLAFFLFSASVQVVLELAPKEIGYERVPKEPWAIIGFLGSVIVAVLFYRICVRFALRNKPKEEILSAT
jgi:uncharacterized membrane protein